MEINPGIINSKRRGEWAELIFMARAAELGISILRPWGDSSPYDVGLIVDQESETGLVASRPDLLRIQIKSTRCRHSAGAYKCHIDSNGVPYTLHQLDFIAAYVIPAKVWYIIPLAATRGQTELLLAPHRPQSKYAKFREAWHLLRNNLSPTPPQPAPYGSRPAETERSPRRKPRADDQTRPAPKRRKE